MPGISMAQLATRATNSGGQGCALLKRCLQAVTMMLDIAGNSCRLVLSVLSAFLPVDLAGSNLMGVAGE